MLPQLHFPKNAFALKLFLQCPERLIDIVVANLYLHIEFHRLSDFLREAGERRV